MSPADQIIVPLDVPTEAAALALLDQLPQVTFWKVGLELFVGSGARILAILKERQKKVFLDLKFHDIPNTMAGACRSAAQYGVELLTVHAAAGQTALQAAQAAAVAGAMASNVEPPNLIAITVLTSLTARALALELKIPLELNDYALQMALLAQASGLAGAVCSPQEVAQLRSICGEEFLLVCPGVRPTWAEKGDQQRAMTPAAALKAGANYLVIGRPITTAADPAAAFERISAELL
ncbi:orotidine-5'-phosphate decarboxylase [Leptolyngbya sp. NK1-12]|uniref:Orotidine 5'-phosphate decarboxylase n=2 Tax=Leptolyngbya sp. NK1-12 TaxID=2547451 RepID=A0AA96WIZ0_9CYAN|nr:orotidine-5'-phosphate decarboxylase [Elainella sp. C42_A2020_010]WNZ26423.1 orotidine-5'-phosphate decarboxylase [Leptolyngbya sp. NK1-12]